MAETYKIRKATPQDVEGIAAVHYKTWDSTYRGILADSYLDALTLKRSIEKWETLLALGEEAYFIYVVEFNSKIIGIACARITEEPLEAELQAIYILPEYQRLGIGTQLLEILARTLDQASCRRIYLWVLEDSLYQNFYEKNGGEAFACKLHTLGDEDYMVMQYYWKSIKLLLKNLQKRHS